MSLQARGGRIRGLLIAHMTYPYRKDVGREEKVRVKNRCSAEVVGAGEVHRLASEVKMPRSLGESMTRKCSCCQFVHFYLATMEEHIAPELAWEDADPIIEVDDPRQTWFRQLESAFHLARNSTKSADKELTDK